MSVQIIYDAPAHLTMPERFLLYSLIYGLRPASVLAIGTAQGGATLESNLTLDGVDNPGVPQKDATRDEECPKRQGCSRRWDRNSLKQKPHESINRRLHALKF